MQPPSESTKFEEAGGFVEYVGTGKLKDKKVIVTGGEYVYYVYIALCVIADGNHSSGIGRAVSVLMAREGADITIVYLPEEQVDADDTKKMIEKEQRQCLQIPTDLAKRENCKMVIDEHLKR